MAAAGLKPGFHQRVVVVTSYKNNFSTGRKDTCNVSKRGQGHIKGLEQRTVTQFERVTQKDEPVATGDQLFKWLPVFRATQNVNADRPAEMQVGNYDRPHWRPARQSRPATASRTALGSMKRTSSSVTVTSRTSAVPRSLKNSTKR